MGVFFTFSSIVFNKKQLKYTKDISKTKKLYSALEKQALEKQKELEFYHGHLDISQRYKKRISDLDRETVLEYDHMVYFLHLNLPLTKNKDLYKKALYKLGIFFLWDGKPERAILRFNEIENVYALGSTIDKNILDDNTHHFFNFCGNACQEIADKYRKWFVKKSKFEKIKKLTEQLLTPLILKEDDIDKNLFIWIIREKGTLKNKLDELSLQKKDKEDILAIWNQSYEQEKLNLDQIYIEKAIQYYTKSISIKNNFSKPYYNLGLIYNFFKKDYAKAITYYKQVSEKEPKILDDTVNIHNCAYQNWACCYIRSKKLTELDTELKKILDNIDTGDPFWSDILNDEIINPILITDNGKAFLSEKGFPA